MKNNIPDSPISPEILRKLLKKEEPTLTVDEKKSMWHEIELRTYNRPLRKLYPRRIGYAAASVAIILLSGWLFFQHYQSNDPYKQLAELVDADTLHSVCLYLGEQHIELDEQVEIRCFPASNEVEIRTAGNASFRLTAPKQKETFLQIAVPTGKKAQVVLADQSRITVRERSKLGFPLQLTQKERTVYLDGEAYMKIAHNPRQRFVAESKDIHVAVLGTEFLLSAYSGKREQSVLLVSGRVEIEPSKGNKLVISPNERYVFDKTTGRTSLTSHVDPTNHISWKEDILKIDNEPLNEVLKKIESIYRINLKFEWNELAEIQINGKLDLSVPIDVLLERLSKIAPINIDKEQLKITSLKTTKRREPMK